MKILLVDDDFFSRKLNEEILQFYGKVDISEDGKDGAEMYLDKLEQGDPYDLICVDIMMPIVSGFDLMEFIRVTEAAKGISENNRATIITISGLNNDYQIDISYQKGSDMYFGKPLNPFKLEKFLKESGLVNRTP